MIEKIKAALSRAGLNQLPDDGSENLANFGMDSLMMVLSVSELEKEFQIKIAASDFAEEHFETLDNLKTFVEKLIN